MELQTLYSKSIFTPTTNEGAVESATTAAESPDQSMNMSDIATSRILLDKVLANPDDGHVEVLAKAPSVQEVTSLASQRQHSNLGVVEEPSSTTATTIKPMVRSDSLVLYTPQAQVNLQNGGLSEHGIVPYEEPSEGPRLPMPSTLFGGPSPYSMARPPPANNFRGSSKFSKNVSKLMNQVDDAAPTTTTTTTVTTTVTEYFDDSMSEAESSLCPFDCVDDYKRERKSESPTKNNVQKESDALPVSSTNQPSSPVPLPVEISNIEADDSVYNGCEESSLEGFSTIGEEDDMQVYIEEPERMLGDTNERSTTEPSDEVTLDSLDQSSLPPPPPPMPSQESPPEHEDVDEQDARPTQGGNRMKHIFTAFRKQGLRIRTGPDLSPSSSASDATAVLTPTPTATTDDDDEDGDLKSYYKLEESFDGDVTLNRFERVPILLNKDEPSDEHDYYFQNTKRSGKSSTIDPSKISSTKKHSSKKAKKLSDAKTLKGKVKDSKNAAKYLASANASQQKKKVIKGIKSVGATLRDLACGRSAEEDVIVKQPRDRK